MHTSRETKGIRIQHGIVWVDQNAAASAIADCARGHGRRGLHADRDVGRCGRGRKAEVWNKAVGVDVVAIHVVEHIGLRIVLLFCTHGLSLGRTKLHRQERGKKRNGSACRVENNASGTKLDSSSLA